MLGPAAAVGFLAAANALVANAILLPPNVDDNAIVDDYLLAAYNTQAKQSRIVRIPCPECAFSTKYPAAGYDEVDRAEDGEKELLLEFEVSSDGTRLELNGATIYPPLQASKHRQVVVLEVPPESDDTSYERVPLRVTSSGLAASGEEARERVVSATEVVEIQYSIFGVEKQLMQLQDVNIEMLRVGEELILKEAVLDTKQPPAPAPARQQHAAHAGGPPAFGAPAEVSNVKACNMLPLSVCRMKAMFQRRLARLRHNKPCPGRKGAAHDHLPHALSDDVSPHGEHTHGHHGRPHHMKPWHGRHHNHHHHRGHHGWLSAFSRGFVGVLVPVAAGIAVGLSVSVIGLVLGRLLGCIWDLFARRGDAKKSSGDLYLEEGKGLIVHAGREEEDEPLPRYEDAPPYVEMDAESAC